MGLCFKGQGMLPPNGYSSLGAMPLLYYFCFVCVLQAAEHGGGASGVNWGGHKMAGFGMMALSRSCAYSA